MSNEFNPTDIIKVKLYQTLLCQPRENPICSNHLFQLSSLTSLNVKTLVDSVGLPISGLGTDF